MKVFFIMSRILEDEFSSIQKPKQTRKDFLIIAMLIIQLSVVNGLSFHPIVGCCQQRLSGEEVAPHCFEIEYQDRLFSSFTDEECREMVKNAESALRRWEFQNQLLTFNPWIALIVILVVLIIIIYLILKMRKNKFI